MGSLNKPLPLYLVFWGSFITLIAFFPATGQDEKNQMMTTNVWLKQVKAPPLGKTGVGWEATDPSASQDSSTRSMILNLPFA